MTDNEQANTTQNEVLHLLSSGRAPALFRVQHALKAIDGDIEQTLIDVLFSDDTNMRRNAAWLLRSFGTTRAVEWLIACLQDDDNKVRQFAALALYEVGDARAIEPLANTLQDPDVAVRLNAVRALGGIGEHTSIALLISILKDNREDDEVQAMAAKSLGLLGAREGLSALFNSLNRKSVSIHTESAMALARLGEPALPRLLAALQNDKKQYRQRRRSAAHALGWMLGGNYLKGNPDAVNAAIEALVAEAGSLERTVRQEIAQALAASNDIRAMEPLTVGLLFDVPGVRRSSAKALKEMAAGGKVPMSAAIEPLIQALSDQDVDVRYTAIEALGHSGEPAAIDALFTLIEDPDPDAGYQAILALGYTRSEAVVKPVSRLLRARDVWTRRCTAVALGRLGFSRGIKPLLIALSDPSDDVRQWAALALAQIGDDSVLPNLIERQNDPSQLVQHAIQSAILELGGG